MPLSIRHLHSFVRAIVVRPLLNFSGRVNHFVVLVDPGQASLIHIKVDILAPLVINMSWHVLLHQLDDCLLQGSPLFAGVLLLGLFRPALRGAKPWLLLLLLLAVILLVLFDSVRRDLLLNQIVIIDSVKFFFGQLFVPTIAKAVYNVNASVIVSPVLSVDNLERHFDLSLPSVINVLDKEISARFLPSPLKLAFDEFTVHASIDVYVAALRFKIIL